VENIDNKSEVIVHYEKNPGYRMIYSDGVIGGETPDGDCINLNFFATRHTIPKARIHKIEDDGRTSKVGINSDDSKDGLICEIEFGVYLKKDAAEKIYELLKNVLRK
jgi:hypothetical protein